MREIWTMQPRLEKRVGRYPFRLIESAKFRAGYDFLLLRCETDEMPMEIGEWWTKFWQGDDLIRQDLMASVKNIVSESNGPSPKRKRRRTRSRNAKSVATEQNN
jgi:poly(A) polymerase